MKLYMMRHAITVPKGTIGFAQDAQRPLTQEGHIQARQVAKGLKYLKLDISCIASSPYVRAMQTAEDVAKVLGYSMPIKEMPSLRSEASPSETSLALKSFAEHNAVLFVGHEPHLTSWIEQLAASFGNLNCVLKKAGTACIEIEKTPPSAGSGVLRWLMSPKHLALIGRAE